MTTHADPFFQVPRTVHTTSQGDVDLPIVYERVDAAYAFFRVDEAAVAPMLTGTGLRTTPFAGTSCLAGLACFAYHETSVGPYNEVGVVVPAVPTDHPVSVGGLPELVRTLSHPNERWGGFHVLHLPVTTAIANAGGRELWGYPKFVTSIDMALGRRSLSCAVSDPDDDGMLMRLDGRLGMGIPTPALSLVTYSVLDGQLLRATVDVRGRMRAHAGRHLRLDVGTSHHPMAETLRTLGLDGTSPVALLETRAFQSRLNAGVPIGTVRRLVGA